MKYGKQHPAYKVLEKSEQNLTTAIYSTLLEMAQMVKKERCSSVLEDRIDELFDELKEIRRERRQIREAMDDLLSI